MVIATRDRPQYLGDCLAGLANQAAGSPAFEVLVIDDGSSVDLVPVVAARGKRLTIALHRVPGIGLSAARNRGAGLSAGSVVAFLDDDTLPAPGWSKALVEAFTRYAPAGVAGRIVLTFDVPVERTLLPIMRAYLAELDLGDEPRWLGPREAGYGCNCAFDRETFLALGGFPWLGRFGRGLLSNEEVWVFQELARRGARRLYAPDAQVSHRVPAERLRLAWHCRRAHAQGVSDELLMAESETPVPRWRNVLRLGRAVPIAARGLLLRRDLRGAALWSCYCAGRIRAGLPKPALRRSGPDVRGQYG